MKLSAPSQMGFGSLLCLLMLACLQPAAHAQISFVDQALPMGFQDRLSHGRALTAADFNGDGLVDFYVGNPTLPNVGNDDSFILWNDGPDGGGQYTFSKGQVLLKGRVAFTSNAVDYDNDGDPDIYIGGGGQETIDFSFLFRNDDGFFVDVSESAGVQGPRLPGGGAFPAATASTAWADYDRDGDLDLYAAHRIDLRAPPLPDERRSRDTLFRNNGDGTFTDVTALTGILESESNKGAAWGDFDGDGWIDLFVIRGPFPLSSVTGFSLYRNNQDGTFTHVPQDLDALGVGEALPWRVATADFNNDGRLDVLVFMRRSQTRPFDSHALLINDGLGGFTNEAVSSGLTSPDEPAPAVMGCQIADVDNNGYPDVLIASGGPSLGERDRLKLNTFPANGSLSFEDVSSLINYPAAPDPNCVAPVENVAMRDPGHIALGDMAPGVPGAPHSFSTEGIQGGEDPCLPDFPYRGHAIVPVDLDGDGDLDLAMSKGGTSIISPNLNSTEPNRFFINVGGNAQSWLSLHLEGVVSNRDAVGARVRITARAADGPARKYYNEDRVERCFSSSGPPELHLGLGPADSIDSVFISWPSGVTTTLDDVQINQRLNVVEPVTWFDRFDAGAENWTTTGGSWEIMNGEFIQSALEEQALAVSDSPSETNSTVVARLTYHGGERRLGLLGRASADGLNFYAAVLEGQAARLYVSENGELAAIGDPVPIEPMSANRSYVVSLSMQGEEISLRVDNGAPSSTTDARFSAGTVGFLSLGAAAFDNIAVF